MAWENIRFAQVVLCSTSIFHVSLEGWEIYFKAPTTIDFSDLWLETPESQTHNWHITLSYQSYAKQVQ